MNNKDIFKLVKTKDSTELELALEKGLITDINLSEAGMKTTLLMTAVCLELVKSVKLLLEYGADPNIQDVYGKTALHLLPEQQPIDWTLSKNKVEIAEILFNYGADINIKDQYDNQPLWTAVFEAANGNKEKLTIVKIYLQHGADCNNKNKSGNSPLDFAKKVGYKPLIDILEDSKIK